MKINKTQGHEVKVLCSKCNGKTDHKVLASVAEEGHEPNDDDSIFHWCSDDQIIQCQGCKTISFRNTSLTSEDNEELEKLYPPRTRGRRGLENDVRYLPPRVRGIYAETLQALNSQLPILTGIGLRAIIETVCKEKNARGGNLYDKIHDLKEKNILNSAGEKILSDHIRILGNHAAHEVKPHSEIKLGVAMDVVEHLLEDVYVLPTKVEAEFKQLDEIDKIFLSD